MPRSRIIKPDFFYDEELAKCTMGSRLLFIGLWTIADKEGRIEDKPRTIRARIMPFDDKIDVDDMLWELSELGFIQRYDVDGRAFIQITNFAKHQRVHPKEPKSEIPTNKSKTTKCREKKLQGKTKKCKKMEGCPTSTSVSPSTSTSKDSGHSPTVPNEYKVDTDMKRVMCTYKELIGICFDDRSWDEAQWKKWARSAKKLLKAFGGDVDTTIDYMEHRKKAFETNELTWNLATVASNAWDNIDREG